MKTERIIISVMAIILLFTPIVSNAQKMVIEQGKNKVKERKGFILDLGIRVGFNKYKLQSVNGNDVFKDSQNSITSDFKIGLAPTNQLAIYYVNKAVWYKASLGPSFSRDITSGITGVGVTYFFKETHPSWYANFGIGVASWNASFDGSTGTGLTLGVGYEFARRFGAELNFISGKPENIKMFSSLITVNYIIY